MAKIGFLLDPDIGHIYPALGLCEKLNDMGHQISLMGIPDIIDFIEDYSYHFSPVFADVYPKGFLKGYKEMLQNNSYTFLKDNSIPRPHLKALIAGDLNITLHNLELDFLIVTYSLSLEALIFRYLYPNIKLRIFTTWLRGKVQTPKQQADSVLEELLDDLSFRISSLSLDDIEFTEPLNNIPEIIACPKEFDFQDRHLGKEVHYINSSVRSSIDSKNFINQFGVPKNKKIIYASLGSQNILFAEQAMYFFHALYQFISLESSNSYFLILCTGNEINYKRIVSIPNKIEVVKWAPQLEILKSASLVITHGGLGTIKESILNSVPMLVVPMVNDEFDNARRVKEHNLGEILEIVELTPKSIAKKVDNILNSDELKDGLAKMKSIFQRDDIPQLRKLF